jgi:hypothetical protein
MFWYPYTGAVTLSLVWPSGIANTSLGLAALVAAGWLALLALRAARTRAVAVPHPSTPLDEEQEVKQAAA